MNMLAGKAPQKSRFLGDPANRRGLDNKRNTCQTTDKNKTGGRGRDEKDKTIGRDEKCPLAKGLQRYCFLSIYAIGKVACKYNMLDMSGKQSVQLFYA